MQTIFENNIIEKAKELAALIEQLPLSEKVETLNHVRSILHDVSPFANEPIDLVFWVSNQYVAPNEYNPNAVAPPEMRLLAHSIDHDGYTQPIVADEVSPTEYKVVDGAHRTRTGKEVRRIRERVYGYLPITKIKNENKDSKDRMAATIRHNRARGKHGIAPMANIIKEMVLNGWKDEQIAKELGMDKEEVLRLKQFNGLPELFKDREFSKAWE